MALWKISVKNSGSTNGVRLEKGMSVEFVTKTSSPPSFVQNKEQIAMLFMSKYGVDLLKAKLVNQSILAFEKVR